MNLQVNYDLPIARQAADGVIWSETIPLCRIYCGKISNLSKAPNSQSFKQRNAAHQQFKQSIGKQETVRHEEDVKTVTN